MLSTYACGSVANVAFLIANINKSGIIKVFCGRFYVLPGRTGDVVMKPLTMKSLLVAGAIMLSGGTASATTTLTLGTSPIYKQTSNSPCVIGNSSCTQGGFAYTLLPSGGSATYWDANSPVYTVSDITSLLGMDTFSIGIDINQASGKPVQTLANFEMYLTDASGNISSTLAEYLSPYANGTPVPALNNGNGSSDYVLSTFSLAGLLSTDHVMFHVYMPNQTDGAEQFFLATPTSVVPIPATGFLLIGALGGLALIRKRRKTA